MRLTRSFVPLLALLSFVALTPPAIVAQGTAADSAHFRATKIDLDSIARDKTAPAYSKRAVARIRLRDSLRTLAPPVVVVDSQPTPAPVPPPGPTPAPTPSSAIFVHPFAPPANGAALATLPQDTVSVAYPAITRVIRTTNPQAALDTARSGDEIRVPVGATYANLAVNPTSRTGWVVLRTDVSDAQLGTGKLTKARADSLNLATIVTSSNTPALWGLSNSHHVYVTGLRFKATATANALVWIGNNENTVPAIPHDYVFARNVLDGGAFDIKRCVRLDAARSAFVHNSALNCHSNNGDSQGLLAINTPGPLRIEDNTLQGGHQAIMFGGGDPSAPGVLPSDVVIRGNDLCRPIAWLNVWQTKTILELKLGQRIDIEGNVLCNVWPSGQAGMAFNIKTVDQGGTAAWSNTSDVTIRWNKVRCASGVFSVLDRPDNAFPALPTARITIYGNVADSIATAPCLSDGSDALLLAGVPDVVLLNNWIANPLGRAAIYAAGVSQRFVATGNVFAGQYGFKGDGGTFSALTPGSIVSGNTLVPFGTPLGGWPAVLHDSTRDALLSGVTIAP